MTTRPHSPSTVRARGRQVALGFALIGLAAPLLALWRSAERPAGRTEGREASVASLERAGVALEVVPEPPAESQRSPLAPDRIAGPTESEPGRATLSGRLRIDGYAPFRGRVHLQQGTGDWQHTLVIDPHGRFHLEDVPAARLRLSFDAEWSAERPLLLPDVEVTPEAGEVEIVDLDWTTRHVNVQVVEDEGAGPVRVELTGPDYRTSFATDELGKAKLCLVGSGLFTFRAESLTGMRAEASVELDEDQELETVVILLESVGR